MPLVQPPTKQKPRRSDRPPTDPYPVPAEPPRSGPVRSVPSLGDAAHLAGSAEPRQPPAPSRAPPSPEAQPVPRGSREGGAGSASSFRAWAGPARAARCLPPPNKAPRCLPRRRGAAEPRLCVPGSLPAAGGPRTWRTGRNAPAAGRGGAPGPVNVVPAGQGGPARIRPRS